MTGKFHLSIQSLGQIEKEISASRDYLTNIIDAIASPVFVKDAEHRLILVNNAECTLAGHSREELLGQTDYDFFPKEQVDKFWEIDNQVLDSGEPNENEERITDAAGRILTIVTHKSRYVDQLGNRFIVGVIRDITEAKRMETALRESEQLFRTLTENSPNIIIRYDREYRRIYVNPSYTRKTGIASDLVLNVVFDNQWPPDMSINAKAYKAKLQQVMETGVPAEVLLEWPCQESGQVTSHLVQVVAEKDTDGRITGCLAIGHDISRLKQAELRMNMLAEASPGVLFNILLKQDGTSCLPYVSHRIEELSGLRPEEMSEDLSKVIARIHPDDEKRVRRSIVDSAARLSSWHSEFRMLHPSKGEVWVEGRSIPELMHNGDIHFNGFLHDITERKKMDE
jgi:PAS domain S-box-containing protein